MKTFIIVGITASLLVIPLAMNAASGETATEPPPIAQALVREGDLAIKLVDRLKIGTAENEAEAESMLASTGIAPRNGWIADYPVTPDIIGELQDAVGEAVDSQRLAMGKDEALRQFQDLTAGMGFSVVADTRGEVAQATGVRNSRTQLGLRKPHHASAHNRVLCPEQLCHPCLHGEPPWFARYPHFAPQ